MRVRVVKYQEETASCFDLKKQLQIMQTMHAAHHAQHADFYDIAHYSLYSRLYRTLKTLSRTVSVQVQSVRYEYQTGHDPNGYIPMKYQCHWARSRQLQVPIQALAIIRSMSQPGHNPHGYNPVNSQRHYNHWAISINAQSQCRIQNVSTKTKLLLTR